MDHDVGETEGMINHRTLTNVLGRDSKFALTFRPNIENLLRNEKLLKDAGVSNADIETIIRRGNALLEAVSQFDKKWNNPWWNEDVETPQIFGKNRTLTEDGQACGRLIAGCLNGQAAVSGLMCG